MKYLIAGLGNVGLDYANTRHNIGFSIVDFLAARHKVEFEHARHGYKAMVKYKGRTLILIKPTTFMNLSGIAVRYWLQKERVMLQNLLVLVDDIALPFGVVRLKGKGSDGGHNGLNNIQHELETTHYPRLRFGIGDEFHQGQQVSYVLGKWTNEEEEKLAVRLPVAADAVLSFCTIGLSKTMNTYNNK